MDREALLRCWKEEEKIAYIHGWDFSHIDGRCIEDPLPWDYRQVIGEYLTSDMKLLDIDTGKPHQCTYIIKSHGTVTLLLPKNGKTHIAKLRRCTGSILLRKR